MEIIKDKVKLKAIFTRVQNFADAMLESMKERFPALPVIDAIVHCCRPSASISSGRLVRVYLQLW